MTWNFQDMILGVYQGHPCCQGWLCLPSLWSGTLNILQVPSFLNPHSWHTSNKDINMLLSGFIPEVENIIHDIRNGPVLHVSSQEPSISSKYPPSWPSIPDILLIKISTPNFQFIFLRVNKHHPWHQGWTFPPCIWSGTLNILQVPPFMTPHS